MRKKETKGGVKVGGRRGGGKTKSKEERGIKVERREKEKK